MSGSSSINSNGVGMSDGVSGGYDFDLVVLGGGSGGLAAAKEATRLQPSARVVVFDLVQPSLHGSKWGLGGTCVNVGCIPKKLMHHAATIGSLMRTHAPQFGWRGLESLHHDWTAMSRLIQDYIKSLNFSYRVGLTSASVKFIEGYAHFIDQHTLRWEGRNGKSGTATFASALIATGGRPTYLNIPGRELAITSDDLFWLKQSPGKTLVIGAGYIALECASFLHHVRHNQTTIA
jgi:thioredoxin reductase (NADPH)